MTSITSTKTRTLSTTVRLQSNPRDALLARLKGQEAHVPDLKPIFWDWRGVQTRYISPLLEPLRKKVEARLQYLNFSAQKVARLNAADFALFTTLWWPDANLEKLEILAYLVIWLFTWDDEIDEPTGSYADDFQGAQTYRDHTLQFVRHCLGLDDGDGSSNSSSEKQAFTPKNKIVQSFDVIGYALRDAYDDVQRRRFYDEMARFMIASEEEQRGRLMGIVPTMDEYWAFRLGTSAVYIGSAAGEYSMEATAPLGRQLPLHLMESKARQAIWDETNVIISITNDLLSLKKEMKVGSIDSIVPLSFAVMGNVQEAISFSIDSLSSSKARFDKAAAELLSQAEDQSEKVQGLVQDYIEVQRSNCVGNLVWSLETARYSMAGLLQEDGSQKFIL